MKKKLYIEKMSCNHCKNYVEKVLGDMEGVKSAKVNLDEKVAVVELIKDIKDEEFDKVISEAGYDLVKVTKI